MFNAIKKRNGRLEEFDINKIITAIEKAGQASGEYDIEIARRLSLRAANIAQQIVKEDYITVEQIQDIVEEVLIASPYKQTAKAYIIYRDQHARIRDMAAHANLDLLDQYLKKIDWQVQENSNMSFSLQGLNNYLASEVSKLYWLNRIYPQTIKEKHLKGDIHIHDLNMLSVYCVGWDLYALLSEGFSGVEGKVESKPAKHFRSALGQVVNFFYTLQGEAAGAQAFSNLDTLLAPFIHYDNLTYKEVKQAVQEFVFNINVPTRVGFQTPFTNVTMDLKVPSHFKDQSVIIGGEPMDKTYGEFQKEMDMFNKAFLEVMTAGDAKGRVFTFPIPTYNITEDFDWDNENIALLWKSAVKYGIPYFSNFINSTMKPEDARSMCCRLRLDNRELQMRGGGLFGASPLTGSIGVVTMNLPRLAYKAETEEEFFAMLKEHMLTAKDSLELKRKVLEELTDKNLYPYAKFYLKGIKEQTGIYWKNHFSTIGLVGMNEACLNLIGSPITSKEGEELALKTLDFMREELITYQKETGNNYNLEATPAEGTSYRLAKLDKQDFPEIVCANEDLYIKGAEPFYTNSTQLPVNYTDDIFEVLEKQDKMQSRYTGGTVLHIFIGEEIEDIEAVKTFIKKVCTDCKMPYFTISPTFSVCPSHGYVAGEHPSCPKCESECEVYSRVVGYLRPVSQWNNGKQAEFEIRKVFSLDDVNSENKLKEAEALLK